MHVNPPRARLGREHALLHGVSREYGVRGFAAPLSLKTVRRGAALWRTEDGRARVVTAGRYLIVNGGQRYDIEIDSAEPVETFCIFFRESFAADVVRSLRTNDVALLEPAGVPEEPAFMETVERIPASIATLLGAIERRTARQGDPTDALITLVETLVQTDMGTRSLATRLPTARAATRQEILRRVLRGRDRIESSWSERLTLDEIAREAAMAPHHFHRTFRAIFGATPHQWLTRRRLDEARRLLRDGDAPVQDVCLAVGFESLPTFTHTFRRLTGTTPARFRASFRKIR